jgi:RNA polymerase sigma-70 factor, ECF subfamily
MHYIQYDEKLDQKGAVQKGFLRQIFSYFDTIISRAPMIDLTESSTNLKDMGQHEFDALVETYQRELRAHCYRMLGSVQEADDMVQETFWRAWDRRETYEGRSTIRAWLYRIATNLCIDTLRQRPRRGLPITQESASSYEQPIPVSIHEPIWLEPYPFDLAGPEDENPEAKYSLKESVKLAFLASLHLLPSRQRAALILFDVLDWQTAEVAEALGQTVPSVKSALHRARATLRQHYPEIQHKNIQDQLAGEALQSRLNSYMKAWETADVGRLVALLKDDCTFSMPPIPSWYKGRENIAGLVSKTIFSGQASGRWRLAPTHANGQVGFGLYKLNEKSGDYDGYGIQVVTFDGELIEDITTFREPGLLKYFGLASSFVG